MSNTIRPYIGRPTGSTARTKQARAVRTREAIVSVAAQHFDTDGYGASSINTILATGKFTKGAIYFHFPSKEAIAGADGTRDQLLPAGALHLPGHPPASVTRRATGVGDAARPRAAVRRSGVTELARWAVGKSIQATYKQRTILRYGRTF